MPPEAIKTSVARIKSVVEELSTLRDVLDRELRISESGSERTNRVQRLYAGVELTYLLRLFTAFEAGLHDLGPYLPTPRSFPNTAGLNEKLERIGSEMRMPQVFRDTIDHDVRQLRNELQHGRSLIPRLRFEAVYELMRQFYKGCY